VRGCGLDPFGFRKGPAAGFCERSNEHSGSIKSGDFLD
jgi:hypothetical protein